VDSNLHAIDQYGCQTMTDPTTGKTIRAKASNDLYHGVTSVVCSNECVTLTRTINQRVSQKELLLNNVAQLLSLVNNTFTWSGPSGGISFAGRRRVAPAIGRLHGAQLPS
jgi:hypothetical protein